MNGMNSVVIGLVAILLVAGGGYAWSRSSSQEKVEGNTTMMNSGEVSATEESFDAMEGNQEMEENAMTSDASGKAMMESENSASQETANSDVMVSTKGSYEAYSPEKLALAASGKVVLFFHASWCPTCKGVDADIVAHVAQIPSGVHILKLDYDTTGPLKQKYGVTTQHTFVQVNAQGNLLSKWSGGDTLATVLSHVQ